MSGWRILVLVMLAIAISVGLLLGAWSVYQIGRMQGIAERTDMSTEQMPYNWEREPHAYSVRHMYDFFGPIGCGWLFFGSMFLFCVLRWLFGWPYRYRHPYYRRWGPPPWWDPDHVRPERPEQARQDKTNST